MKNTKLKCSGYVNAKEIFQNINIAIGKIQQENHGEQRKHHWSPTRNQKEPIGTEYHYPEAQVDTQKKKKN